MARENFNLIAEAIADADDLRDLVNILASRLATTNPNFDRTRFIEACRKETDK